MNTVFKENILSFMMEISHAVQCTKYLVQEFFFNLFFPFIFISWRLITLQYCSGFCHTLT